MMSSDTSLEERIRRVLIRLEVLSEADAANLHQGKTSHSHPEATPPPGAIPGRNVHACPPRDRSLWDHFRWKLEHADSPRQQRLICRAAERAWEERKLGADRVSFPTSTQAERDPEKEAQWVVEYGEGIPADEVAAELQVSRGWVEKVRSENRRRPKDGRPKPGFLGMDDAERRRAVGKLQQRGMSQAKIAVALGVARDTIRRYMKKPGT